MQEPADASDDFIAFLSSSCSCGTPDARIIAGPLTFGRHSGDDALHLSGE